ncbi:glycosyl hydrolase 115 family protein [Croceivirga radicis]|uniref:glycosyl hydrolase 115 family protein n=1 Tax=Croceivirga radicis TaxID=1929488 RepID=UPI000255ABF9|nr:glycosyl hydrolase 115 family protein [Croceivirga radicis]
MRYLSLVFFNFLVCSFYAQSNVPFTVDLVTDVAPTIITDAKDAEVVHIAAQLLVEDIFSVTGKKAAFSHSPKTTKSTVILAGTLGHSKFIDQLVKTNKINVDAFKGSWERYGYFLVANPHKNIDQALVVVGSDRRGTAYGLLQLSKEIGVSAWKWWADVEPAKQERISLQIKDPISASPSVKYRGIFLNDEDWGLQPWAAKTFEPETGDIGPKTYAKIFELMLRLKANTVWPAMHSSTQPFYSYPENKVVADQYAIVVGSSHAEPMLSNINMEWNKETMGEYRYDTNAESIKELFTKRAKETANFEAIYTTGMRGEHDSPMILGDYDIEGQVKLLETIISDQRSILEKTQKKPAHKIPQAFIPYKEVLTSYQNGLEVPEDITLIWTDDNYGYIRQLSTPEEQQRKGGAGVYYHTSYWGRPHDYLWLNSTHPLQMWSEMKKAYLFGAKDIWILNVGDIKPHEYNLELFLDMAWNIESFKEVTDVKKYNVNWLQALYGDTVGLEAYTILEEERYLSFKRRPEFMAWSQTEPTTKPKTNEFSQFQYGDEVGKRLAAFKRIEEKVERLYNAIDKENQSSFYQLVYYPVMASVKMNQKWLYTYKNEFYAKQNRQSANDYAVLAHNAYKRIVTETNFYNNELLGGKWKHIISMSPRYLPVYDKPSQYAIPEEKTSSVGVLLEGYDMPVNNKTVNSFADVLPVFNRYTNSSYFIDLFLKGEQVQSWSIKPLADWIKVSATEGTLLNEFGKKEERLWVTIDWEKVPKGKDAKEAPLGHDYQLIPPSFKTNSALQIKTKDTTFTIGVSAYNPKFMALNNFNGFVEDKGYVSIKAANYTTKTDADNQGWVTIPGLGYSKELIGVGFTKNGINKTTTKDLEGLPVLTYDFYSFNLGEAIVSVSALPTHPVHKGRGVKCAIAIDDGAPVILDFETIGRSDEWKQNVLKNKAVAHKKQLVKQAGKHTLKIWMLDEGLFLDQILIDLGGRKQSYNFPPETRINN